MAEEMKETVETVESGEKKESARSTGKTFTQEEVNRIISERLKRAKLDQLASPENIESAKTELEQIRGEIAASRRTLAEAYLAERKLPASLLDYLDSSDMDAFKAKVESFSKEFTSASQKDERLLQLTRKMVTREYGLPDELSSRLIGESEDELRADAKKLTESLSAVYAPNRPAPLGSAEHYGDNYFFPMDRSVKHVPKQFGGRDPNT